MLLVGPKIFPPVNGSVVVPSIFIVPPSACCSYMHRVDPPTIGIWCPFNPRCANTRQCPRRVRIIFAESIPIPRQDQRIRKVIVLLPERKNRFGIPLIIELL